MKIIRQLRSIGLFIAVCMTGELNYTGGAYDETKNYKFAFAFSGGLSEDDLEVAKFGISYLKSLLGE